MKERMDEPAFREHPFVSALDARQLCALLGCARAVEYEDEAFIFREGGEADTFFLVRSGCVVLEQHIPGKGVVIVESLCAGDVLGLSWLLPAAHWTLDARCIGPVKAFSIPADCVRERMRDDPALGVEVLTRLAHALYQRLVRVRLQRLDVYKAEG